MFILIGEGTYDEIFFSQLIRTIQVKNEKKIDFYHSHDKFDSFRRVLNINLTERKRYYTLFVWGDSGIDHIINYTLKLLRPFIGNYIGKSMILVVMDDDYQGLKVLPNKHDKIENYINNSDRWNKPPKIQIKSIGNYLLQKNRHDLHLSLKTVPNSLEYQICKEIIERMNLSIEINSRNIHDVLNEISIEIKQSKEDIIRNSVEYLEKLDWCQDIKNFIEKHIS